MIEAAGIAYVPLYAPRYQIFSPSFTFKDVDLTAATFLAQVRQYPGAPGDPLVTMNNGTPTLVGADTLFGLSIGEAGVTGLPSPIEPGGNVQLWWDLQITQGGIARVWMSGPFYVINGVTRD